MHTQTGVRVRVTHLCWVLQCLVQHLLDVSCNGCLLLVIQGVLNLVGHRTALKGGGREQ